MNIWRLIAHHESAKEALELMKVSNRIAIGWPDIGDLSENIPQNQSQITKMISKKYPTLDNATMGGASLWNLFAKMQEGDYVILNANSKRVCVFEVTGPYIFSDESESIFGYCHQRPACLTEIDAEDLWNRSGAKVEAGQNIRWTLVACSVTESSEEAIYTEGARFSITSTAYERNPKGGKECLEHFGYKCNVCNYDFAQAFGELGNGFIHVHHRVDIATRNSIYKVDPKKDLVPLCPNCHAMAHRMKPAVAIEELKMLHAKHKNA